MSVETFEPSSAVTVTEAAKQHFLRQLSATQDKEQSVRISIKESGCTGYMYVVDLVDDGESNDIEILAEAGLHLFVSAEAMTIMQGTEIDLTREGVNKVITFKNPNVASECGCGESFNVK